MAFSELPSGEASWGVHLTPWRSQMDRVLLAEHCVRERRKLHSSTAFSRRAHLIAFSEHCRRVVEISLAEMIDRRFVSVEERPARALITWSTTLRIEAFEIDPAIQFGVQSDDFAMVQGDGFDEIVVGWLFVSTRF